MCGYKEAEDSDDNGRSGIIEKLSVVDTPVLIFDFDPNAVLLGYPRYLGRIERLHQHR